MPSDGGRHQPRDVKPSPSWLRTLLRSLAIPAGWTLIVLGLVVGPLPGPGGIPVVALGVLILLQNSRWARRRFIALRQRYPKILGPVENVLRRKRRRQPPPPPPPES